MKTISIFVIALTTACSLHAQTVRLINSTQQSWSGGIAGRHGENYTFVIEFSDFKKEPAPDTLWIGQHPVLVILHSPGKTEWNTKRTTTKKTVTFEIHGGTSADDYADRYPNPDGEKKTNTIHAPISYRGIAMLSYTYKGKQQYYTINKIMKRLTPLNYP